ncbi:MAG: TIGR04100 family radical SAM protein [Erysipelotrichaceae bacterium]|nr:TIGR04100 family radical SAM protein [Erysipelotrichaceae bacterium]
MMILYTLHSNGYIDIGNLDNLKDVHVYVNLTNRCPCACTFCLRQTKEMSESNTLWLKQEPTAKEVMTEFQQYNINDFAEVTFCGFGEPLTRVDDVVQIASFLKNCRQDLPIRINTNGLGNLINERDITPQLEGCIDTVSISLNAPDENEYLELTRSRFGIQSFDAMLEFAGKCKDYVLHVVLTVVDIIGDEKIQKCQKICDDLGVQLRVRPFEV